MDFMKALMGLMQKKNASPEGAISVPTGDIEPAKGAGSVTSADLDESGKESWKKKMDSAMAGFKKGQESMKIEPKDYSGIYAGAMQRAAQSRRPIYGAQMMSDERAKTNVEREGMGSALAKAGYGKPRRRSRGKY